VGASQAADLSDDPGTLELADATSQLPTHSPDTVGVEEEKDSSQENESSRLAGSDEGDMDAEIKRFAVVEEQWKLIGGDSLDELVQVRRAGSCRTNMCSRIAHTYCHIGFLYAGAGGAGALAVVRHQSEGPVEAS
jgi:hypothetical protein